MIRPQFVILICAGLLAGELVFATSPSLVPLYRYRRQRQNEDDEPETEPTGRTRSRSRSMPTPGIKSQRIM